MAHSIEDLLPSIPPSPDAAGEEIPRPDLTPTQLAVIAREVATNLREIDVILENVRITRAQFDIYVATHPYYQKLLESYTTEWEAPGSTNKRLAFQAAAALEEKLPLLASRMGSHSEDLSDAVNAAKLFTQLAGAGTPEDRGVNTAEKFNIQINIGSRTISVATAPKHPSGPEISLDPQGALGAPLRTDDPPRPRETATTRAITDGT